jgi:hypothetical protein
MSDRLTDSQITEGLRLAGEATPGPWSVSDYAAYIFGPQDAMVADDCPHCAGFRIRGYGGKLPQEQNAKWIAHAGTHYAAALAEVQALRGQVGALNKAMTRVRNADIRMMTGVQRHSVASAQAADPNDEAFHRGVTVGVDRCREILAEALAVSR